MEEQLRAAGLVPSWSEWKRKAKKGLTRHLFLVLWGAAVTKNMHSHTCFKFMGLLDPVEVLNPFLEKERDILLKLKLPESGTNELTV